MRQGDAHLTRIIHMKQDWQLRVLDLLGHLAFAIGLPGHWYWQFLPDLCVPVLLTHYLFTLRLMHKDNPILWLHNALHTIYFPVLISIAWGSKLHWGWEGMLLQTMSHVLWDQLTHPEAWHRKSLWKINQQ